MFEACCCSSYFALVKHSMSAGRKGSDFCSILCILRVLSKSHDAWRKPADAFRRFQITPRGRRPNGGKETTWSCTFDAKTEHNNRVILSVAPAGCECAQINSHRPNLVNAQRVHVTRDSDRLCYGAADVRTSSHRRLRCLTSLQLRGVLLNSFGSDVSVTSRRSRSRVGGKNYA